MKNKIVIICLIAGIGAGIFFSMSKKDTANLPVNIAPEAASEKASSQNNPSKKEIALKDDLILYYSDGCGHCVKLKKYIAENDIDSKLTIIKKDVTKQENSMELGETAQKCGLDTSRVGIPFLYTGSKCLMGDQDIIKLFNERIEQNIH